MKKTDPRHRLDGQTLKDSSGCWLYTGSKSHNGYGHFRIGRKTFRAHRIAWELAFGAIPEGVRVLHTCDQRACVNPEHLFLGTQLDNMADCKAKGRNARGAGHGRYIDGRRMK